MPPTRTRIRHRSELIRYAYPRVRSRACQKAFYGGTVEVLGGFDEIPPSTSPGWVLRVSSKHNQWLIAVTVDELKHVYLVWKPARIPWEFWSGQTGRSLNIYDGDKPEFALAQKEASWPKTSA